MRLHSCEYRGTSAKASTAMVLVAAALMVSATAAGVGPAHSAAQESAADVGYVEDVSGRVVAFSQGKTGPGWISRPTANCGSVTTPPTSF